MKSDVFERRKKILDYLSRGVSNADIVRDFSKEWGVTQNAIRMDLRRINKWAPQILRIHDGEALMLQLYNNMKLIIPNAWHEYYTADNSSAKVGALRLIMVVTEKLMNMLQSMGVLKQAQMIAGAREKEKIVIRMWQPPGVHPPKFSLKS